MRKRWRWLWVAIPLLGLLAALVMPRFDDFAEYERTGTRIEPGVVWDIVGSPPNLESHHDQDVPGARVRAWRLDLPAASLMAKLRAGTFYERGGESTKDFSFHYEKSFDGETGTETTVLQSANLPNARARSSWRSQLA